MTRYILVLIFTATNIAKVDLATELEQMLNTCPGVIISVGGYEVTMDKYVTSFHFVLKTRKPGTLKTNTMRKMRLWFSTDYFWKIKYK